MKIRNGFVSNSSSSSFLVAFKLGEKCNHCGRRDTNLLDIYDDKEIDCDGTYIRARGPKEVVKELKDWYEVGYKSDYVKTLFGEKLAEHYKYEHNQFIQFAKSSANLSKYLNEEYEIIWMNVSYNDEESFKKLLEECSDAKIIEEWH